MQIIPAIDLINGQCVRLTQGDYAQKTVYHSDPLEVAKSFEGAGLKRLHLVDLDGAKAGHVQNLAVLERIATSCSLQIDFGGGVSTTEAVNSVLNAGATWVTVGSIAAKDPNRFTDWLQQFGAKKFLLGADVKEEKIAVHGWLETTELSVFDFIADYLAKGIEEIFCTDVSKDGKLEGPSIDLYKRLLTEKPTLKLIASGGVSSLEDLEDLASIGCHGAIIGKAIYEGRITLQALEKLSQ
jgi:phosphoribosylformimino-5-aminoimidazole carboxamide ribotide isomerase